MTAHARIDEIDSYLDGIMSAIIQSDSNAAGKEIYLQKVKKILELKAHEFDRMKQVYGRTSDLHQR